VGLIAGLGLAAELAVSEWKTRRAEAVEIRRQMQSVFDELGAVTNGDPELGVPHILNVSVPGIDSEAAILALRGVAAISNGSACTSASYEPSHVLTAMGLDDDRRREAIRLSWGPGAVMPDADQMVAALQALT
jgi:cysteine desulfurase